MSSDRGKKCLTCDQRSIRRGLCHACYQSAATQVRKGSLTWPQAEKLGIAAMPRRYGSWMKKFRALTGIDDAEDGNARVPQDGA